MIMPGDPMVGDAFRTENIPGVVFEEVTVKTLDRTVAGPSGPVHGAMVGQELHDDGTKTDKVFAPGYGEFLTRDTDGVEALALAVPTDALDGAPPAELRTLARGADHAFAAAHSEDWKAASVGARTIAAAWTRYGQGADAPPRLEPPMNRAVAGLRTAAAARNREQAATAAIDVAQAELDLELRYLPPAEIDLARFDQWNRQLAVDAQAGKLGAARGDVVTMGWIRDRFAQTIPSADRTRIDTELLAISEAVNDEDLDAVRAEASRLRGALRNVAP